MRKNAKQNIRDSKALTNITALDDENKVKKLEDYEQAKPLQLDLFGFTQPQEKNYSNTIELYDFMPKYYWGKFSAFTTLFLNRWNARSSVEAQSTKLKLHRRGSKIKKAQNVNTFLQNVRN